MLFANINALLALALLSTSTALAAGPRPHDIYRDHARMHVKKSVGLSADVGVLEKKNTNMASLVRRKSCKAKTTTSASTEPATTKTSSTSAPTQSVHSTPLKNVTAPTNTGCVYILWLSRLFSRLAGLVADPSI